MTHQNGYTLDFSNFRGNHERLIDKINPSKSVKGTGMASFILEEMARNVEAHIKDGRYVGDWRIFLGYARAVEAYKNSIAKIGK